MPNRKKKSNKKSYQQILSTKIAEGLGELSRPRLGLFLSALSAGLDIGFSVLLMATVITVSQNVLNQAVTELLVATMYSVGFIFVILGKSELFTEHTTLAVLPVLGKQATIKNLLVLWTVVWSGNILGAGIFALIASQIGPQLGIIDASAFATIAQKLVHHPWWLMLFSAILAGWMMGILSWLISSGRDIVGQVMLVFLVTASIGLLGLHHSIIGTVEVLTALFTHQEITLLDFSTFIIWTTIGNVIGGVFFVAIIKFSHAAIPGDSFEE